VQTAARAPICSLLFQVSQTERNEGALARKDKPRAKDDPGQPAGIIVLITSIALISYAYFACLILFNALIIFFDC